MKKYHYHQIVAALALTLLSPLVAVAAEPQSQQLATAEAVQESAAARLAASHTQDPQQLARRFESVGHLLETSSAARQIEASKDSRALAAHEEARALYVKARDAFSKGDVQQSTRLLTETTTLMFKAVRFAAPADVTGKKMEADFRLRRESVQALLTAYKRIASEKSVIKGVTETTAGIEHIVNEADKLAEAGKYEDGRAELDQAYIAIKTAVRALRHGDTLVRTLNFANKEEEYRYELDRNDTHQMLIKVLVDEKRAESPDLDRQVSAFVVKAKELRADAEASAARKDYAGAIKLLEDSTTELVRAIRNAGVYIPG
jgi:hypothetical protein